MVRYFANKKQKQNGKQRIDLFAQFNGCSSYYYRLFELKWNEINQESITRRNEQNLYHGVFTNSFFSGKNLSHNPVSKTYGPIKNDILTF